MTAIYKVVMKRGDTFNPISYFLTGGSLLQEIWKERDVFMATTDSATEKSMAVVQLFIDDLADDGHLDRPDEYLAKNFVYHDLTYENPEMTAKKFQKDFDEIYKAFTNISFKVEETIATAEKVVVRWVFSGLNTSYIRGLPPTNKQGVLEGISIFHLQDGKISDLWMMTDILDLLQQLGVIPTLGTLAPTDPTSIIEQLASDPTSVVGHASTLSALTL